MPLTKPEEGRPVMALPIALSRSARDFPGGGIDALATLMGKRVDTMYKKLNPQNAQHEPTMSEFAEAFGYLRDPRLMDSICALYDDAVWFDLRTLGQGNAQHVLSNLGELVQRVGATAQDVAEALKDNSYSVSELKTLRVDLMLIWQAGFALLREAEKMAERAAG